MLDVTEEIRRAMREKGVSLGELGRRLGLHLPGLSASINGGRNNFTVKRMERIAKALDMKLVIRLEDK